MPDEVVLGSENAGLDANYVYYFERNPQALILEPTASNPVLALSGCPMSFALNQVGWTGAGEFDPALFVDFNPVSGVI